MLPGLSDKRGPTPIHSESCNGISDRTHALSTMCIDSQTVSCAGDSYNYQTDLCLCVCFDRRLKEMFRRVP